MSADPRDWLQRPLARGPAPQAPTDPHTDEIEGDAAVVVTFFIDHAATTKREELLTLEDLAERIRATDAATKQGLPWLKLARFGDQRTDKNSLRHNANIEAVTGVEADYDGEQISLGTAVQLLTEAGLRAAVYASPSHTDDTPRWRVLCPCSEEHLPTERDRFLARLNGLFGGAFSRESWTLSQSYYFGSVGQNPSHSVVLTEGDCIDRRDDLDAAAIGKPNGGRGGPAPDAPPHRPAPSGSDERTTRRLDAMIERLLERIRTAPDQTKHNTLFSIGRTVGGYLAGYPQVLGWTPDQAADALVGALPASVKDWNAARQTARDAIRVGMQAPLFLEERDPPAGRRGPPDPLSDAGYRAAQDAEAAAEQAQRRGNGAAGPAQGDDTDLNSGQTAPPQPEVSPERAAADADETGLDAIGLGLTIGTMGFDPAFAAIWKGTRRFARPVDADVALARLCRASTRCIPPLTRGAIRAILREFAHGGLPAKEAAGQSDPYFAGVWAEVLTQAPQDARDGRSDRGADGSPEPGDPRPEPPPHQGSNASAPDHDLPVIPWLDERLSDWAERDVPPQDWVMEGWIPRGQCTGLYGVGGIHKTRLLIQLLLAKSKGMPFLGIVLEPGPVYGLFCEDTREEIVRRAIQIAKAAWGFDSLADFPDFHFASLVGVIDKELVTFDGGPMKATAALHHLDRKIIQTGAQLMTLDTLPHFYGGNEIVRRDVTRFISRLEGIGIARGCGIVFTAHPSQRGRQSGALDSGSTGWEGGFRARVTLHDPEEDANANADDRRTPRIPSDRRIVTLMKANYAAPGATIDTVLRDGAFFVTAVGPEAANRPPRSGPGRNDACDRKFLELLAAVTAQNSYVSDSVHSGHYAPKLFASRPDGNDFSAPEYSRAMQRLFAAKRLRMGTHGWPLSRASDCIVDVQVQPVAAEPEPAPEAAAPEPPVPPPTRAEIDAAIAAHIKLDEGERAVQRPALAERLLGPKKLKVFDALVLAARKAPPKRGGQNGK
jgi:hypothetical protein